MARAGHLKWLMACAALPLLSQALTVTTSDLSTASGAAQQIVQSLLNNWYESNPPDVSRTGAFKMQDWQWWQFGGAWTAILDYYHYTHDDQYLNDTLAALYYQTNPGVWDIMPAWQVPSEANDDEAFWAYGVLTALESEVAPLNCPSGSGAPGTCGNSYLDISTNVFKQWVSRWNVDTCNGGLAWHYNPSIGGARLYYKQSVANAALFQTAARLHRYTGGQEYLDWANKVWDWSTGVGFVVESTGEVFDGAGDADGANCTQIDGHEWSYNIGSYLIGAAVMANSTSEQIWLDRTTTLVKHALGFFAGDMGILYEPVCETVGTCNDDQPAFKGYLARWLGKTMTMVPELRDTIRPVLEKTAVAAAQACVGPTDNAKCGMQWYNPGGDGSSSMPRQLAALQAVLAVLAEGSAPAARAV